MRGLVVAVQRDDLHALLAAVVPGPAVAELLPGGAPPRQQVVLAVVHVVALATGGRTAGRGGRGWPAGEARGGRPAADGRGPDLVEAAGEAAGPPAEGRPAVKSGPAEGSSVKSS